jgi:hypothetical protein
MDLKELKRLINEVRQEKNKILVEQPQIHEEQTNIDIPEEILPRYSNAMYLIATDMQNFGYDQQQRALDNLNPVLRSVKKFASFLDLRDEEQQLDDSQRQKLYSNKNVADAIVDILTRTKIMDQKTAVEYVNKGMMNERPGVSDRPTVMKPSKQPLTVAPKSRQRGPKDSIPPQYLQKPGSTIAE